MGRYVLVKLGYGIVVLFGVVTVIFLLFTALPGDPAQMMLGQREDEEQLATVRAKYGFDLPLWKQYLFYINDLSPISVHHTQDSNTLHFLSDEKYEFTTIASSNQHALVVKKPYLRESFQKTGTQVTALIANTLPNTAVLATAAIFIAFLTGILLGIASALTANSWIDRIIGLVSTLGMSVPSFFSAILMAWIFGYVLNKYTGLEMTGSLYRVDDFGESRQVAWKNLILPALTLGIRPLAVITQLTRNSLLDVMKADYIRTATAKGLSPWITTFRHALRNSLNPVITATSGWFAGMLAGAVFVEFIFGWNGLGKLIVDALNNLDLPVVMGSVIAIAAIFVIINITVDILYGITDPRIRIKA